ncbi:hypothetical protein ACIPSA_45540 [Streptomyces sp. NPDC086549]|uniref:hypothetical protein n=1 Tax=Streptomyces sp. NPDC086549 TaxID=3365752 RepID=UPI0037F550E6
MSVAPSRYRSVWDAIADPRPLDQWEGQLRSESEELLIRLPDRRILYQGGMTSTDRWRAAVRETGVVVVAIGPMRSVTDMDAFTDDMTDAITDVMFDGRTLVLPIALRMD